MNNNVALEYLETYNIEEVQNLVEKAFLKLNIENVLKDKKKVMLKVCASHATLPDAAETTHPTIVRAVANILYKYGIKSIIVESPYGSFTTTNLETTYFNTGMLEVANLTRCDLNHNLKTYTLKYPNGVITKHFQMLQVIQEVDAIINIGKLKLDKQLGFMGSVSNLFGLIPGNEKNFILNRFSTLNDFYLYNLDLFNALRDKVSLNIVDAVVALEAEKTPRLLSCLGVSENAFALDATLLDILKIDYNKTILKQAQQTGLFNYEKPYKLVSEKLDKFTLEDFALLDFSEQTSIHSSKTEQKRLFNSTQKRVVIDKNKCKGCGICTKICPTNALFMKFDKNGELYSAIDYDKCIFCYKCLTACPYKVVDVKTPIKYKKLEKDITKYN